MTFKAPHYTGLALTAGGILSAAAGAFGWLSSHVTVVGSTVCADGVPATVTGAVTAVLTVAGALVLLRAPSTSDAVNVKAAVATGTVLPTGGK